MNVEEREAWGEIVALARYYGTPKPATASGNVSIFVTAERAGAILAVDDALRAAEARIANLEAALATHDRARLEAMRRAEAAEQRAADAEAAAQEYLQELCHAKKARRWAAVWKRAAKKWRKNAANWTAIYGCRLAKWKQEKSRAEAAEAALLIFAAAQEAHRALQAHLAWCQECDVNVTLCDEARAWYSSRNYRLMYDNSGGKVARELSTLRAVAIGRREGAMPDQYMCGNCGGDSFLTGAITLCGKCQEAAEAALQEALEERDRWFELAQIFSWGVDLWREENTFLLVVESAARGLMDDTGAYSHALFDALAALDAARGGGEQELDDGCGMGGAVSG